MAHFAFWTHLLALIAGCSLWVFTLQFSRIHRQTFLKPLASAVLFFNTGLLSQLMSRYLLNNFFADIRLYKSSFMAEVIDPFSSLFFFATVYFLTLFYGEMIRQPASSWLKPGFIIASGIVLLRTLLTLLLPSNSLFSVTINALHLGVQIIIFLILLSLLFRMSLSRKHPNHDSRDKTRQLAFFFAAGFCVVFFSALTAGSAHPLINATVMLCFNIYLFFWIPRAIPGHHQSIPLSSELLQNLYTKHDLSKRQQEIVDLMLQGHSNREIASALYIAPHTVKNHIYMLYQKLGIKTRYELVNLFIRQG